MCMYVYARTCMCVGEKRDTKTDGDDELSGNSSDYTDATTSDEEDDSDGTGTNAGTGSSSGAGNGGVTQKGKKQQKQQKQQQQKISPFSLGN